MHVGAHYRTDAVRPSRDYASPLYALGMQLEASSGLETGAPPAERLLLLVSKSDQPLVANLANLGGAPAWAEVLEAAGDEPGFAPPAARRVEPNKENAGGRLQLGAYAVALVRLSPA